MKTNDKNISICKGVTYLGPIRDVPDGFVLYPDGSMGRVDDLRNNPNIKISIPDTNEGKIMISPTEMVNISEFPLRYEIHVSRENGKIVTVSNNQLMMIAGSQAITYLFIGIVLTYVFVRLKKNKSSKDLIYKRGSFMFSVLFFLVATLSLFLGITGSTVMNLGSFSINTALPSMVLYAFSWLTWRRTFSLKNQ